VTVRFPRLQNRSDLCSSENLNRQRAAGATSSTCSSLLRLASLVAWPKISGLCFFEPADVALAPVLGRRRIAKELLAFPIEGCGRVQSRLLIVKHHNVKVK
jgi:hypothetical protein